MQKKTLNEILFALGIIILLGVFFFVFSQQKEGGEIFGKSRVSQDDKREELDPWKEKLTTLQYQILREKGTEKPYTSPLVDEHRKGTYYAADTNEALFRSEDKFDSGTGWPSFTQPIDTARIETKEDTEYGLTRTEVLTSAGGHLGHVFPDGPEPTGLRYCINGAALYFVPDSE